MKLERAHEIVAGLTGSCQSIEDCLEPGESFDDELLCETIDENIFNCTCCGWWCENEEMAECEDGPMCHTCHEDA